MNKNINKLKTINRNTLIYNLDLTTVFFFLKYILKNPSYLKIFN